MLSINSGLYEFCVLIGRLWRGLPSWFLLFCCLQQGNQQENLKAYSLLTFVLNCTAQSFNQPTIPIFCASVRFLKSMSNISEREMFGRQIWSMLESEDRWKQTPRAEGSRQNLTREDAPHRWLTGAGPCHQELWTWSGRVSEPQNKTLRTVAS